MSLKLKYTKQVRALIRDRRKAFKLVSYRITIQRQNPGDRELNL